MVADASGLSKLVPGFDFLEGLVKNAGAAIPGMGQWVAPTLDPQELERRIQELRTVQYWLEQNAVMLGTTIQALEVQRMTLATLKTMNVQMADLRESLLIPTPKAAAAPEQPKAPPVAEEHAEPAAAAKVAPAPAVDPMQWWGALTKQFGELAAAAIKNGSAATESAVSTAAPKAPAGKASAKAAKAPARKRSRG